MGEHREGPRSWYLLDHAVLVRVYLFQPCRFKIVVQVLDIVLGDKRRKERFVLLIRRNVQGLVWLEPPSSVLQDLQARGVKHARSSVWRGRVVRCEARRGVFRGQRDHHLRLTWSASIFTFLY